MPPLFTIRHLLPCPAGVTAIHPPETAASKSAGKGRVLIVDDDAGVRDALFSLLRVEGHAAERFASAGALLDSALPDAACCIVADMRMPGIDGLELLERLKHRGEPIPVIFLTGYADVPLSVRAMKAGAVDFLSKPCNEDDLLDAVEQALERDHARRADARLRRAVEERFDTLTPRERQVMACVVRGLMNKQIAWELEISEITVKLHRSSLMRKMQLRSVPDLVRAAQALDPAAA